MTERPDPAAARARAWLERDRLLHIDMLECIDRGVCRVEYAEDDGVFLVCGDYTAMISCPDTARALELIEGREYPLLVLHQLEQLEPICARYPFYHPSKPCWQGAYLKKEPLPELEADIRVLDESSLPFILAHYDLGGEEPVADALRQGEILGCFVDGRLAGFVGMHPEGSIGMLFVLPEYRRRGLADALERRVFNRELAAGHVPYGQIFVGNEPSRVLHEKLGVVYSEHRLCWLWKD